MDDGFDKGNYWFVGYFVEVLDVQFDLLGYVCSECFVLCIQYMVVCEVILLLCVCDVWELCIQVIQQVDLGVGWQLQLVG